MLLPRLPVALVPLLATLLARVADASTGIWLTDFHVPGELHFCLDEPLDTPVCVTTTTETGTTMSETTTTETSTSVTTMSGTTDTTHTTDTRCFMYADCFTTCPIMISSAGACEEVYCPTCSHAHICDTSCGFCAYNITTSQTSTLSTGTGTTTSASTTSATTFSATTDSATTITATTTTTATTGTETTFSECVSVNIMSDSFCNQACATGDCLTDQCITIFCPNCGGQFAGMCDEECGFCTTQTETSSSSATSSTETSTTFSSSVTTRTTTSKTSTTLTSGTTISLTTFTSTGTTSTASTTSSTTSSTQSTDTTSTTASTTTCLKYPDCVPNCADLVALDPSTCETQLCPTCVSAHICDTYCGICAGNVTITGTSSLTTGTATTVSGTTSSTTDSTTSQTTSTTLSFTTGTATTTTTASTFSVCVSVNLMPDSFCNATCQTVRCEAACSTLFCPGCHPTLAGMCDEECGFCTTHTTTESTTLSSVTTTRTTTSLTTTTSTSSFSITSTSSGTTITTITVSTTTVTGTTDSTVTTTTTSVSTTTTVSGTETTTTCSKLADCIAVCPNMVADCDRTFCPTCVAMHLCDTTCGFCHDNSTSTQTTTESSTSRTSTSTGSESTSTFSTLTSTASSVTLTGTTITASTTSMTETTCVQVNGFGDAFCNSTCIGVDCPIDMCQVLFCPTCEEAGGCDLTCNFCTSRITTSGTTVSSVTSTTVSTMSQTSSATCQPCLISTPYPIEGVDNYIPCGTTVTSTAQSDPCINDLVLTFECPEPDAASLTFNSQWNLGASSTGFVAAWGIANTYSQARAPNLAIITQATGDLGVHCQTCGYGSSQDSQTGIQNWEQIDEDANCNELKISSFKFGPNMINGVVDESFILGYKVYLVRACDDPLTTYSTSRLVAEVDAYNRTDELQGLSEVECACQGTDKYSVAIETHLPYGERYRLMVVPVSAGNYREPLPIGLTTDVIVDHCVSSHLGNFEVCYDNDHSDEPQCPTSTTTTLSSATQSITPTSTTRTTGSYTWTTHTGSTSSTVTTCFKYPDCFDTCEQVKADGLCFTQFGPFGTNPHLCDTTCGICAENITTSETQTVTTGTVTSQTGTSASISATTISSTESSTVSVSTTSATTTTTASSVTECLQVDIAGFDFCNQSQCLTYIEGQGGGCRANACETLFCPTCVGPYAGVCDATCNFCTTLTATSSSSLTSLSQTFTSESVTRTTKTTTITYTTTSRTTSSVTTFSTTATSTSMTTRSDISYTVTTTSESSATATSTYTTCFMYEDCLPSCNIMERVECERLFCPTCSAAHFCDTSCGICALNTTESATSTATTGSATTTTVTGTTVSVTTGSTITTITGTTVTTATTTTTTESTFTGCLSVNILDESFCNTTCISSDEACVDPCEDIFCPSCAGSYAGMCDKRCGFCTSLTQTSTGTTTTTDSTRSTTETVTSTTTSVTSVSATTISVTTATSITTVTSTTKTRSTITTSLTTATTTGVTNTVTETTTTCYKYEDCLLTCPDMVEQCDTVFCPFCGPMAHQCDTTCGFCAVNTTSTETTTESSTSTASTVSVTGSTVTQSATTVTTVTQTTDTATTTTSASSVSDTPCLQVDLNETFCHESCTNRSANRLGEPCPQDTCNILFCLTCPYAGHCDLSCNFCTSKSTVSETSETTTVSSQTTSESSTTTKTCGGCHVSVPFPAVGCEGTLQCGQTCTLTAYPATTPCVTPVVMQFLCEESPQLEQDNLTTNIGTGYFWGGLGTFDAADYSPLKAATLTSVDSGDFDVQCFSCGIMNHSLVDEDCELNKISVTLSFGPNTLGGVVNEAVVEQYAVFFVPACDIALGPNLQLKDAVALVEPVLNNEGLLEDLCNCHETDKYSVQVEGHIDWMFYEPGTEFRFLVVPVMNDSSITHNFVYNPHGEFVVPAGRYTDAIADCATITTTTTRLTIVSGVVILEAVPTSVGLSDLLAATRSAAVSVANVQGLTASHTSMFGEQEAGSVEVYWTCTTVEAGFTIMESLLTDVAVTTAFQTAIRAALSSAGFDPSSLAIKTLSEMAVTHTSTRTSRTVTSATTTATSTTGTTPTTTAVSDTTTTRTSVTSITTTLTSVTTITVPVNTATATTVTATPGSTVTSTTVTSRSQTSTTETTTTEHASYSGDITVTTTAGTLQGDVQDSVVTALKVAFGVSQDAGVRILSAVTNSARRLQVGSSFSFEYEIIANVAQAQTINAKLANIENDVSVALQAAAIANGVQGLQVTAFGDIVSESAPGTTTPPVRSGGDGGDSTLSSQADSSSTVFILGGAAFVVLFCAVLIPTVFRRRLRALLGLKRNNNANAELVPRAPLEIPEDAASRKPTQHDWDVDNRAASQRPTGDTARVASLEAVRLSPKDGLELGAVQGDAPRAQPDV